MKEKESILDNKQLLILGIVPLLWYGNDNHLSIFYVISSFSATTKNFFVFSTSFVLLLAYNLAQTYLSTHLFFIYVYVSLLYQIPLLLMKNPKNENFDVGTIETNNCCIITDVKDNIVSSNLPALNFFKTTKEEIKKLKISELLKGDNNVTNSKRKKICLLNTISSKF